MKWSITQLRKYQDKPFEFNQTANFEHLIEPLGLIDLSEINVEGIQPLNQMKLLQICI